MGEAVLVFPGGMPDGLAFRDRARAAGLTVIGASSLDRDPASGSYELWEKLPYVSDPNFDGAFADLVKKHGVSTVHAPHFIIWKHLTERLNDIAPGARLTGGQTPMEVEAQYRALIERTAHTKPPAFWPALPAKPELSNLEKTGLVRLIDTIPGMCGEEKMHAVMEMMRYAPAGDIVEIGSWCGRSASLFTWLSRRYGVGPLLSVDPWASEALPQGDALLDAASAETDPETALRMYEVNLAPLAEGRVNYIRARSEVGAARYGEGLVVTTQAFGTVAYSGHIAVLHIDGNHTYEQALLDTQVWSPHVMPCGWIIFDDYEWAFGDGPKIVADDFIAQNRHLIAATFAAGAAMFVQLKSA